MKKTKRIKKQKRGDKYWICPDCAVKRGWYVPPDRCNTVILGLCGHCDREDAVPITPVVDFVCNGRQPIFD